MKFVTGLVSFILNRYIIATGAFILLVLVFGPSNLSTQWELSKKVDKVETEKQFYLNEIEKNRKASKELMTNMDNLERFAREKYWMKRENEDVYLVIRSGGTIQTKKK